MADKKQIEELTKELIKIGNIDGYYPKSMLDPYMGLVPEKDHDPYTSDLFEGTPPRNKRAYEIGKIINEMGGFKLMQQVHGKVQATLGAYPARKLEQLWGGVGQWMG